MRSSIVRATLLRLSPPESTALLVGALAALACSAERGTATGSTRTEVPAAVIDTDATLVDVDPGRGVGLFVEYAAGGHWRVYVTCDTLESSAGCLWDVLVSSHEPITGLRTENLGEEASVEPNTEPPPGHGPSAFRFVTHATTTLEGVRFEVTPGAAIRLDVLLDDVPDGRYVYWVGGDAVHRGAPSPVLDLLPTAP